jgi:hypothetical protein
MISAPDPQAVLDDLGDKFLRALSDAVVHTRAQYADVRAAFPQFFRGMQVRALKNMHHDRICNHLFEALDGCDWAVVIDNGVRRDISLHGRYLVRIKAHDVGDRISSYPTGAALRFWNEGQQPSLPGLEQVTLAAGYRFDRELKEIGEPVISFRLSRHEAAWAVELHDGGGTAQPISWTPIEPTMPTIDLAEGLVEPEAEEEQGQ